MFDRCAGRMTRDSTSENRRHGITMTGMTLKIFPIEPGTKSIGMNAATVVKTANTMGVDISQAPSMAPRNPCPWCCWCVWMFSPTTMASSTTIPNTRMKAKMDKTLMETSNVGINQIAPRNEIGIPRLVQNANRRSRNRASEIKTSTKPPSPLRSSRESCTSSASASFSQTVSASPSGSAPCAAST